MHMSLSAGLTAVVEGLPYILGGVWVTLTVVAGALAMGLILGTFLSIAHVYGNKMVRMFTGIYVWFFRGVPLLVLLFLFYFGLLDALHLDLSAFLVSIVVLGLISSAYQSQILRGAILSLPEGQLKAARAIGMSDTKAIVFIILPQAFRLSIPGWSNEYTIIMKNSAVTYALGVAEIMARANHVAARTYQHFWLYLLAGFIFLALTYAGTKLLGILQKKIAIKGYAR